MPYFKGRMENYVPRRSNKVTSFDDKFIAGKRRSQGQDVFTVARLWIYPANPDYPTTGINFGLSNGAGSCFTQLTLNEFDILFGKLTEWKAYIDSNRETYQQQENIALATQQQQDAIQRQMMSLMNNIQSGDTNV